MEALKRLDSFDLNDHQVRNDEVKAIARVEHDAFISNRKHNLASDRQATQPKLMCKAMLIR